MRHGRSPEEVALAGVEDGEGAGTEQHSCHTCPGDQKCNGVEEGENTARLLRMLEISVMEPWAFKLTLCRFLIKKHGLDEMHEAER